MTYIFNKPVSVKALADLRESVGWNRMESEYKNPLLTSYYHIAVMFDEQILKKIRENLFGFTEIVNVDQYCMIKL